MSLRFSACNLQSALRASAVALAILIALSISLNVEVVGAKELQWRRGRVPASQAPRPKSSASANAARTVQQGAAAPKSIHVIRDSAVRLAAFEEEGAPLQLSDASTGHTSMKSVVVSGDDHESEDFRAAQLPMETGSDTRTPANNGSRYEEELRTPFGTEPPTDTAPPATTPDSLFDEPTREVEIDEEFDMESIPLPDGAEDQLRTNGQQPSPADRPPTFQSPEAFQLPSDDRLPVGPDGRPLPTVPTTQDELAEERDKVLGICEEELHELKTSTLVDVDLRIGIGGTEGEDFPFECTIDDGSWHAGRTWDQTTYMWKASALCHKPLYFENESLERYGHSWGPCLDPLVSGAHFFTRLPVLPYCMGVEPPHECVYALGHYRPGSCAPYMIYPVPLSARGAVFQAGAVVGAAAILP